MRTRSVFLGCLLLLACGEESEPPGAERDAGTNVASDGGNTSRDGGTGAPRDGGTVTGEPAELAGTTEAHNVVRRGVGVPDLVWDDALADVARRWAERCVDNDPPAGLVDHNDGRSDDYPGYVGENIYASTGTARGPAAVQAWADEVADYDYANNTCAPNRVCGHYTQVVWDTTERVGCAVHRCAGLRFPNTIVCNYSPGGNTGGRPY